MKGLFERLESGGYEELVFFNDSEAGLKAIIAIHSTVRGPALGGTRMWTYPSEVEAIEDALCLARGMSYKSAAADLPLGGGKAVIMADPRKDKTEALFRAYGRCVDKLNGRFVTAEDMGINEKDLDIIRKETTFIMGGSDIGSPSPFTAYGVWKGIRACVESLNGSPELKDLVVAVQGVGGVGIGLCQHLHDEGVKLIITDIDQQKMESVKEKFGARAVDPDQIYDQECDIFAPCGAGGIINQETVSRLKCRIVAGSANNVLKDDQVGAVLVERNILYAPDYVINAGGIISVELKRQGIKDEKEIYKVVGRIEGRIKEILRRSSEEKLAPEVVADIFAEEQLKKGKG